MTVVPSQSKTGELLTKLVAIPSTSGNESDAVTWLTDQMSHLGFGVSVDLAGNAVGSVGTGPKNLLLLGHIDTVPGAPPVKVENGILFGRGAVDAKGSLATFVGAAANAQLPTGVRVTVIGAVGEESLGSPGASWLRDHYPPPEAVIIGEPSGYDAIVLGYKGAIGFTGRLERTLTHSAGPDRTAAELAIAFWQAVSTCLATLSDGAEPGFNTVDGTLRALNTGGDGLIEWAVQESSIRLPPQIPSATVRELIDEIAAAHNVRLEWRYNAEGYRTERTSPLVAPFMAAIRQAGVKPRIKVKTGTSDMNVVGPAWGCPILAYGPGDASYDHTPDEQISLAEVDQAVAILTIVIETIAGRLAVGIERSG